MVSCSVNQNGPPAPRGWQAPVANGGTGSPPLEGSSFEGSFGEGPLSSPFPVGGPSSFGGGPSSPPGSPGRSAPDGPGGASRMMVAPPSQWSAPRARATGSERAKGARRVEYLIIRGLPAR